MRSKDPYIGIDTRTRHRGVIWTSLATLVSYKKHVEGYFIFTISENRKKKSYRVESIDALAFDWESSIGSEFFFDFVKKESNGEELITSFLPYE